MREILFRGKPVSGERYFVEGGAIQGVAHELWQNSDRVYIMTFPKYLSKPNLYEVIPSTVGQYTGLTDKNGKRIFEGDVLRIARKMDGMGTYYYPAIECPVNVVVKWDMCAWLWETIAKDKRYIQFPDAWCHFEGEVIGNIHDNPELMGADHEGVH